MRNTIVLVHIIKGCITSRDNLGLILISDYMDDNNNNNNNNIKSNFSPVGYFRVATNA
jgi:hypothetical protein